MRILVVGGGGREHALVWKLAQSPLAQKIYCAPGNAGIAALADCVPISVTDLDGLADFAEASRIDLTVVGPEIPLIAGIVDRFESRGLRIFGPSADPARIEGSKSFAKQLMTTANIPTAAYRVCDSAEAAHDYLDTYYAEHGGDFPVVIKANGLAAGKGVTVAQHSGEARAAIDQMMRERVFGEAGEQVVIEECLFGEEASIMAITDGSTVIPLLPAQDHKRIGEGDTGANTGGMGAYTPVPAAPPDLVQRAMEQILEPAVKAIGELGLPYRGILYAGVMMTSSGLKTIEFNCRLGDPETQAVLPMLESDLLPLLISVTDCSLEGQTPKWRSGAAAAVVAAAQGYPAAYESGRVITGLTETSQIENCLVFHSGTRFEQGQTVTAGGRVLSVTGRGVSIIDAVANAYVGLSHLNFEGITYRRDIGHRALNVAR